MSDLLAGTGESALATEEEPRDPTRDYPWKSEDEGELSSYLENKAQAFADFVRSSRYFRWCRKSWNFYYSQVYDTSNEDWDVGVMAAGDQGELALAQINHHRNLIRHLYNIVTRDRPALKTRARNSDLKSLRQADLGQGLVEYYLSQQQAEIYHAAAIEHCLVIAEGFLCVTWDPMLGDMVDADPAAMQSYHRGDLSFTNPYNWNVIRDLGVSQWSRHKWLGVRQGRNKWELLAQFPDHEEAILGAERWDDFPTEEGNPFDENAELQDTDEVECFEWWHKRSLAMPRGRYVLMCGGEILLDTDMPYRDLPLGRVTPADFMVTPFGYTPAFDLIGIQQLINMVVSTIATIVNAFGIPTIWKKKGDSIEPQSLGGLYLLESREKPELLEFSKVPPELFNLLDRLIRHAEIIAGIDQITRGAPDEHVRSGAYAALLQAQSVQFSSSLVRSSSLLLEWMGTHSLRILRDFLQEPRVMTLIGKHNRVYQKQLSGDQIELIDRVTVETTNPVMNTISGKIEFANLLLQQVDGSGKPLLKTPEEILHVFQTGQVETMLEADTAMLSLIREENEQFLDGEEVAPPMPEQNHVLHLREHFSIFGTKETVTDPNLRASVQAHALQHIELLLTDPNTQMMQAMLGYEVVIPPGAMAAGAGTPPPVPGAPEGMPAGELTAAPEPMDPNLDGRSVAQIPEPAQPPGVL